MKGYNLATLPLHSLTVSLTQSHRFFFNTITQCTTILQCFPFIGKLPWENTIGHPIPWACKLLANKHPKKFFQDLPPKPPYWDMCTVKMGYKHD